MAHDDHFKKNKLTSSYTSFFFWSWETIRHKNSENALVNFKPRTILVRGDCESHSLLVGQQHTPLYVWTTSCRMIQCQVPILLYSLSPACLYTGFTSQSCLINWPRSTHNHGHISSSIPISPTNHDVLGVKDRGEKMGEDTPPPHPACTHTQTHTYKHSHSYYY